MRLIVAEGLRRMSRAQEKVIRLKSSAGRNLRSFEEKTGDPGLGILGGKKKSD